MIIPSLLPSKGARSSRRSHQERKQNAPQKTPGEAPSNPTVWLLLGESPGSESPSLQAQITALGLMDPRNHLPACSRLTAPATWRRGRRRGLAWLARSSGPMRQPARASAYSRHRSVESVESVKSTCRAKKQAPRLLLLLVLLTCYLSNQWGKQGAERDPP